MTALESFVWSLQCTFAEISHAHKNLLLTIQLNQEYVHKQSGSSQPFIEAFLNLLVEWCCFGFDFQEKLDVQ